MTTAEVVFAGVGAAVGAVGSLGSGFFWLGKLQGKVTNLTQESGKMEKRVGAMEKTQTKHKELLARVDEKLTHIKEGQEVLFEKFDTLNEYLLNRKEKED